MNRELSSRVVRMARSAICAILTTVTVGSVAAQAADICFEAESANTVTKPWVIAKSPTASGQKCVVQPLLSGRPPAVKCYAYYKINVAAAGKYYLWGRALWPNGCANSVDIIMDKGAKRTLGQDGTYQKWHWVQIKGSAFILSKGVHTVTMWNREDGPGMDEFYLTTDAEYKPAGAVASTLNNVK